MGGRKSSGSGKSSSAKAPPRWQVWLQPGLRRTLALLVAAAGVSTSLALGLWLHVRESVLARDEYRLDIADVDVTPLPDWIRTDVAGQVLSTLAWDPPPSILNPRLTEELAQAFALHPWVRRVVRVTKHHPARVEVELEYRRASLMVEVTGGWLPVDDDAVVLPAADFSPREAEQYPRLVGARTAPLGPEGTSWGDPVVAGAARIGAAVAADWQTLGLASIRPVEVPVGVPHGSELHGSYEIWTVGQTRIVWGHAPGEELSGEPSAADKVARLKAFAAQQGSLDTQGSRWDLDLRPPAGLQIAPKTVRAGGAPVTR